MPRSRLLLHIKKCKIQQTTWFTTEEIRKFFDVSSADKVLFSADNYAFDGLVAIGSLNAFL